MSERLSTNFWDHYRHMNPHKWLPGGASTISQLCLVPTSRPVQRQRSEMVVLSSANIHYPRRDSGCGTSSPLSIFIIRKGETMVLFQLGGSVNLGEVLQRISHQVFLLGKPMPSGIRSLGFNNSWMRPSLRHGNACRIISLHAPITAWRSGSSSKASIMG
jgi:hypothetical protein